MTENDKQGYYILMKVRGFWVGAGFESDSTPILMAHNKVIKDPEECKRACDTIKDRMEVYYPDDMEDIDSILNGEDVEMHGDRYEWVYIPIIN